MGLSFNKPVGEFELERQFVACCAFLACYVFLLVAVSISESFLEPAETHQEILLHLKSEPYRNHKYSGWGWVGVRKSFETPLFRFSTWISRNV